MSSGLERRDLISRYGKPAQTKNTFFYFARLLCLFTVSVKGKGEGTDTVNKSITFTNHRACLVPMLSSMLSLLKDGKKLSMIAG